MWVDIYCREDIKNAILSAEAASQSTALAIGDPARAAGFREGYQAALRAVAIAFGLVPVERQSNNEVAFTPDRYLALPDRTGRR